MSNSQVETANASADVSGDQEELKGLLGAIASQIGDADRRHTGLLDDLRTRVEALGVRAERVRDQVPDSYAQTFSRLEEAMVALADRLRQNAGPSAATPEAAYANDHSALVHQDAQAPAPLRWGVPGSSDVAADASTDAFDVVGEADHGAEPWDAQSAEALTRIYEAADAGIVRPTPDLEAAGPIIAEMSRQDHHWFDERLSEIASHIQQLLNDTIPENSFLILGERFEQFEQRVGSALEAVATRSDLEGLRLVEVHINELANYLDHAQEQLTRLDGIEAQLAAVMEHMCSQSNQAPAANAPSEAFLREIATAAAEQAALRTAQSVMGRPDDVHVDELRNLLKSFIDERREGDEQTYTMLDTVQQAMIRILDRVDALEVSQSRIAPAPQRPAPSPEPVHAVPAVASMAGAPAEPALRVTTSQSAATQRAVESSPIERMRQDFIADAQRAKLRASAEPAAVAPKLSRSLISSEKVSSKTTKEGGTTKILGVSPKLLVSALAIVVAVNGALLYLSSSDAPAPIIDQQSVVPNADPAVQQASKTPDAAAPTGNTATPEHDRERSAEEAIAADKPPESKPRVAEPDAPDTMGLGNVPPSDRAVIEKNSHPVDSVVPVVPQGIMLQTSPNAPSGAAMAHLQNQQTLAGLSAKVGTAAVKFTPAALINGTATPQTVEASLTNMSPLHQSNGVEAVGERSSALDLPPATVGPLSLRLAAAKGDPSAEFEVAARLAEGKGTNQNFVEAVRWYQRSAAQGFVQAQYRLGTLYERGLGVKADIGRARSWYQRAADLGNVKAMHNLAVLSASKSGSTPDYATAAQWFQKAAEHGLADSQFNLAVLYENGLGVAKDPKLSYKWYSLASTAGDKEALRRRDALRTQLSQQDLNAADALVLSFTPAMTSNIVNDARAAGEDWKKRQQANEAGDRN